MQAGPSTLPLHNVHTPVSADTSSNPDDALPAETPWTGALNPSATKWFKTVQKPGRKAHPYTLASVSLQQTGDRFVSTECRFFPWVGPWKPRRAEGSPHWEGIEGLVLIAADQGIIVGRCTDETPWKTELTVQFEDDEIYCVVWSFDIFTLHPLAICGGAKGLVHIVDIVEKTIIKTLKGHGDEIQSLAVCQAMPHIVASTSPDLTIRIWNIHGAPRPILPAGEQYSENYGMGDADEGTECVAILAGRGAGHMSKCVTCAFHPKHAALATGGGDHVVKIWALPPLPKATRGGVTPRGYRPTVVFLPIFSTARIHDEFVDWIDWISDDVLASRDPLKLVTWQWTGYKRFFHPLRFDPMSRHAQISDWDDSHSWAECIRYNIAKGESYKHWYVHAGLHRPFRPTPEELESQPNLVTSCLLGMPANSLLPMVHLFNPSLAEPYDPPKPFTKLRPLTETEPWREPQEVVAEIEDMRAARARAKALRDEERRRERENARKRAGTALQNGLRRRDMSEESQAEAELDDSDFEDMEIESDGYEVIEEKTVVQGGTQSAIVLVPESLETEPVASGSKASNLVTQAARITVAKPGEPTTADGFSTGDHANSRIPRSNRVGILARDAAMPKAGLGLQTPDTPSNQGGGQISNLSLTPWVLSDRDWRDKKKTSKVAKSWKPQEMLVQAVGIQPRGAKFIVGVGDFQTIFVWMMK